MGNSNCRRTLARAAFLEKRGYTVIRFTNEQVHRQFDAVLAEIVRQCDDLA